uniref:Uncharacterized protein n=1 Tax=Panagrolaimus sp. JU765 TaxID=591449 RepID=A0AC34R7E5_9BILA
MESMVDQACDPKNKIMSICECIGTNYSLKHFDDEWRVSYRNVTVEETDARIKELCDNIGKRFVGVFGCAEGRISMGQAVRFRAALEELWGPACDVENRPDFAKKLNCVDQLIKMAKAADMDIFGESEKKEKIFVAIGKNCAIPEEFNDIIFG